LAFSLVQFCKAQAGNEIKPYLTGLFVMNADTIQKWYVTNLDFKIREHKMVPEQKINFYLLEKNGFLLEIIQRPDALDIKTIKDTLSQFKYLTGFFKTGFYVTNINAWLTRLHKANVKIEKENLTTDKSGLYILCSDPEGNLVQLFQKEN
jgi:Glyoxalase/Bleomycin resistance protein/Dioxygenase superfamily